jgi:hypothetical protein
MNVPKDNVWSATLRELSTLEPGWNEAYPNSAAVSVIALNRADEVLRWCKGFHTPMPTVHLTVECHCAGGMMKKKSALKSVLLGRYLSSS